MINKKTMWKIITVTIVALAVSILITAVGGVITLLVGSRDTEPPVITAAKENIVIDAGSTISYRSLVNVSDDSGEECDLEWKSTVDQNTPGKYTVKYRATDASGNVSDVLTISVEIKAVNVANDKLMALIAQKAKSELGYTKEEAKANNYSKEKIVRDIFIFVADPNESVPSKANIIFLDSQSNSPNQYLQNGKPKREGWKTDWEEEAYLTLNGIMKGDCYTFYSVSKAFFEYFEIPNVGVQRTTASPMTQKYSGTHYWNIVKVEDGWYYYDSTRYAGRFTKCEDPCLVTEEQLLSYVTSGGVSNSGYYYIETSNDEFFDADDNGGVYPTVEKKEITD
ncbi:MAG: hypothetical protein IJ011_04660 [Clostridia bacterium]|nr:hypothetical protein [Clostridia bacterium]